MKFEITKIAIIGDQIVTTEQEARAAARNALDWNGSSEGDSQAECMVAEVCDDDGNITGHEVLSDWGAKANHSNDNPEVLATFTTEAEANAFAVAYNEKALADWAKCDWVELPRPIDFIYFGGCDRGDYPQSRRATISANAGTEEIEVTGYGNATYLRDAHSFAALTSAVEKLVEALK